ncbi:MAG: alginate export family protein [Vicinamibacterales bacterium]
MIGRTACRLAAGAILVAVVSAAVPGSAAAQAAAGATAASPDGGDALTIRYGAEYWIRASRTTDFDFDGASDDGLNFGWHRVKPFFALRKRWFELMLQGQDSRSYGVPDLNPNGSSTYASRTSQLDFVKAFVALRPRADVLVKVGREQADGIDMGLSRKLASSSNYGTVLKSFDQVSVRWERPRASLGAFVASPVNNLPYALNTRRHGEVFWGVQALRSAQARMHRAYLVGRHTDRRGPASESGASGTSATYALGVQEVRPIGGPRLVLDVEGLVEWGHRSTDRLRAGALFATATRSFSPDHSVFVGYYRSSGDGRPGDGTTHLFDTMYASGFNNYGYLGLSQGRNIGDLRVGGSSRLAGPATLQWAYHDQALSVRQDRWYAIFTPDIARPGTRSSRLGREIDATLLLRFPFARRATIALGYLAYFPGRYVSGTGPHATAQQFAIDIWGEF